LSSKDKAYLNFRHILLAIFVFYAFRKRKMSKELENLKNIFLEIFSKVFVYSAPN